MCQSLLKPINITFVLTTNSNDYGFCETKFLYINLISIVVMSTIQNFPTQLEQQKITLNFAIRTIAYDQITI